MNREGSTVKAAPNRALPSPLTIHGSPHQRPKPGSFRPQAWDRHSGASRNPVTFMMLINTSGFKDSGSRVTGHPGVHGMTWDP
jgi:hypothetical protein